MWGKLERFNITYASITVINFKFQMRLIRVETKQLLFNVILVQYCKAFESGRDRFSFQTGCYY